MHTFLKTLYEDHQQLEKLLKVFDREVDIFEQAGEPDYTILETGLEYCLEYMEVVHHRKEEQMLQQLREQDAKAASQANALRDQHHQLEHLTREVSALFAAVHDDAFGTRDALVKPARRWSQAYRDHLQWEEELLFNLAQKALRKSDWDKAQKNWQDAANPLHDKARDHHFSQLAEAIASVVDS